ncbi:YlxM family DNA-binding protein [Halonatronum saccharophilum]|uniref:YlxM family DNA-binding protein n=1 Tax=Halonatronum saccharophilum TaxID=150060 RepID=UPI001FE21FF8|nr:YlxM family DNA-binding protein [Halonatronum saccharophilum]
MKLLNRIEGGFLLSVDKVVRIGKLFSFYGKLLTQKQQEFVKLYYYHDLSLGEIAEQKGISRQGVYDNLKRSEEALEDYEEKLKLLKHYQRIEEEIEKLEDIRKRIEPRLEKEELEDLKDILIRLKAYQEGELV